MQPKKRELQYRQTADLIPYALNSRTHDDDQVAQIAASIKEFGFTNPILIDGDNGIIAGHGRIMAAKKLNLKTVPVIVLDDLTETQKKAYVIADNKIALNAGWDDDALRIELQALQDFDYDLALTGFTDEEILALLEVTELPPEEPPEDAGSGELPAEPITKRGDLWILGNHRLLCGDSTFIGDIERLLNGEVIDCVFTDPPYGIGFDSETVTIGNSKKYDPVINDGCSSVAKDCFNLCLSMGFENLFFWGANHYAEVITDSPCWIVWDKQGGKSVDYADCELCYTNLDSPVRMFTHIWDGFRKDSEKGESRVHPTQKPVKLFIDIWDKYEIGNKILDLFGGSGTTIIASEQTKRSSYNMEISEKYCDVIIKRWQETTGQAAVLESTGETFWELSGDSGGDPC